MQSPDWPDLPFVTPAAYGRGRDGQLAMYSVIHYTAGSERSTSAEDGAAYDARRTDGTSTTYFHDMDSTVQCVRLADRANSAFYHGNRQGIHHELCGSQQTRAQWLDPASRATIRRAAAQIVRDHTRLGIPFRRLTPAQVRACWDAGNRSIGGICGHVDITRAWPEDHGTHEDPGTEFPWDVLFSDIEEFRNGGSDVKTLVRYADDPTGAVYLTDFVTAKHVKSGAEINDYKTLAAEGSMELHTGTGPGWDANGVRVLGRGELIGTVVADAPTPDLSDAQLDALADKVAARLRALQFVPVAPPAQ